MTPERLKSLALGLEEAGRDWKVIPDNFVIKIRGESLNEGRFAEAREKLRNKGFWEDEKRWSEIAEELPNYRLSKFKSLMPK